MVKQPLILPVAERLYELVADWEYSWFDDLHREWRRIAIKAGYRFDGASVPRFFWTLTGLTPDGLIRAAALPHDLIYEHKGIMPAGSYQYSSRLNGEDPWRDTNTRISRREADQLFLQIMKETGMSSIRRKIAFIGVRVGGGKDWNDND